MSQDPAIPLLAPVPAQAYRDLFTLAEHDWPPLTSPGARIDLKVSPYGAALAATFKVRDVWTGQVLASRTYAGQWSVGGSVTWSPS